MPTLPLTTTSVPVRRVRAIQAWLNQMARTLPVSSPRIACVDLRRRPVVAALASQTVATIVCCSPGLSWETLVMFAKSL